MPRPASLVYFLFIAPGMGDINVGEEGVRGQHKAWGGRQRVSRRGLSVQSEVWVGVRVCARVFAHSRD